MWTCRAFFKIKDTTYNGTGSKQRNVFREFKDEESAHRWAQTMVEARGAHYVAVDPPTVS